MATKNGICKAITTTAQFLGNSDRPKVCKLEVKDFHTFDSTPKVSKNRRAKVSFSRKAVRAMAKAVLTERQKPRPWTNSETGETGVTGGLYILKDVNIKALKDAQLGELLGATNPNGVSKYYTTIRRMAYQGRLAEAIASAEEDNTQEPEAKPQKKTTKKARKPKASKEPRKSKTSKKTNKEMAKVIFDKTGNLKTGKKPKASTVAKGHITEAKPQTVEVSASFGASTISVQLPVNWEKKTNHGHWFQQCLDTGVSVQNGWTKVQMAVMATHTASLLQ